MSDSSTKNSSHADPVPHAFLNEIKLPLEKRADIEARVEQRTARGIEAALNSLEIPNCSTLLHFEVSVSAEGYQVFVAPKSSIIQP